MGGKLRKTVVFLAAATATGYVVYRYYEQWKKHEVLVEVTEVLHLPETNSESFADLSVPVEGNIRVKCNLRWPSTFRLMFKGRGANNNTGEMSASRRGGGGKGNNNNNSLAGTVNGSQGVQWEGVETNMIVNPLTFLQLGAFEFSPALYGEYLIAQYRSYPHESYTCAASVKNCWVYPGGSPLTYRVTLELHIHETVGEVALSFILEKGAEVVMADSNKVGSWRRVHPKGTEYLWDVGNFAFGKGITANHGPVLGEPALAETVNPRSAVVSRAAPTHKSSILILPLTLVYTTSEGSSSSTTGGGAVSSFSLGTNSEGGSGPLLPGVTLTYTTTRAASGLEVMRMKVMDGSKGPKPFRAAYHRTLHSQPVEVVPQM